MGIVLNWSTGYTGTPASVDDAVTNFPPVTDGVHDVLASHVNSLAQAVIQLETIQSGLSPLTIQDEGSTLTAATTTINFTGAGVTATNVGSVVTINIPGGGGGSGDRIEDADADTFVDTDLAGSDSDIITIAAANGVNFQTSVTQFDMPAGTTQPAIVINGDATSTQNAISIVGGATGSGNIDIDSTNGTFQGLYIHDDFSDNDVEVTAYGITAGKDTGAGNDFEIGVVNTGAPTVSARNMQIYGGRGGAASGATPAGNGSVVSISSGRGGEGGATGVSGNGGNLILTAGLAGVDGGAGVGTPGELVLTARGSSTNFNDNSNPSLSGFAATSIIGALNELKSSGGSAPLWAWNGTDTSQFDPVPMATSGQSIALSVLAPDATQNRPTAVLNLAVTWTGGGGGLAIRLADTLVLPNRFRVVMGITQVDSNVRGGPFFYNGASWGGTLLGGGTTFGAGLTRQVLARTGAAFPPFDLPPTTPAFAAVDGTESKGGIQVEMSVAKLDGSGGNAPAFVARLTSKGSSNIPDVVDTYTLDRGNFFGTGLQGSTPVAAFTDVAIDSFGLVFQSVSSLGTYNVKVDRLEIWAD